MIGIPRESEKESCKVIWGHHEETGHTILFVINALGCEIFQKGAFIRGKI